MENIIQQIIKTLVESKDTLAVYNSENSNIANKNEIIIDNRDGRSFKITVDIYS